MPFGASSALEPVGDLHRHALLDLQAPGEEVHDAGELGQADDPLAGQVADVGHAVEREQVVLAQRVEGDRGGHDHLVVALVGERRRVELARGEHLGERGRDAPRRLGEALTGEVGAQGDQQIARGDLGRGQVGGTGVGLGRDGMQSGGRHGSFCVGHSLILTPPARPRMPKAEISGVRIPASGTQSPT